MDNTIGASETESGLVLSRASLCPTGGHLGRLDTGWFVLHQPDPRVLCLHEEFDSVCQGSLLASLHLLPLGVSYSVVFWLARRFRIERQHQLRRILIHALVGLVLVSTMSAVHYPIFMALSVMLKK